MAETSRMVWKYFLHGILFSILSSVLTFVWLFIAMLLVVIGLFIGFIIGLVVLFFICGFLNALLTEFIWNISMASSWKSFLVHGFVLFIVLTILSIPYIFILMTYPSIITSIVLFIAYCFIDGFAAKNVATHWEESPEIETEDSEAA